MMRHSTQTYIEVRGPWPVLVDQLKVTELRGCVRSISVDEARHLINLNLLPLTVNSLTRSLTTKD